MIYYIILFILNLICDFAYTSQGLLFTQEVKAIFGIIHTIGLIVLCVLITINLGWLNLLYLMIFDIVSSIILRVIFKKMIWM